MVLGPRGFRSQRFSACLHPPGSWLGDNTHGQMAALTLSLGDVLILETTVISVHWFADILKGTSAQLRN